jgi:hypothetical protein
VKRIWRIQGHTSARANGPEKPPILKNLFCGISGAARAFVSQFRNPNDGNPKKAGKGSVFWRPFAMNIALN